MKYENIKIKKIAVCLLGLGITSYVVLGQNNNENSFKTEEKLSLAPEINNGEERALSSVGVESIVENKGLDDVNVPRDNNVPKLVGIDATKKDITKPQYPTIPGFEKKENGIIGRVPNEERVMIQLIDIGTQYELRTSSEVLYDEILQSYVKQIMDYYKGHKYTAEIKGVHAVFRIDK